MSQITAINPQILNKRRPQNKEKRFNIFIDGKFAFASGEENILKYRLRVNSNVEKNLIEQISQEENIKKLTDSAINFLSYRPRSEKEVTDFLIKKISQKEKIRYQEAKESELIIKIITKLKKYSYINDSDFANWWVESRDRARQKGKRIVKMELLKKGVDKSLVEEILSKSQNELQLALKVLEKKRSKLATLVENEAKRKIYYLLASRGFEPNIIKEALQIFLKRDKIS